MRLRNRFLSAVLAAGALLAPVMITGCAAQVGVGYRVYDPYYHDYHVWHDGETVYYNQWLHENHRKYRDFRKLNHDDQRQYWTWRHGHPDHH
ncbi:MAG: hypothetical protein ACRD2O_10585 [Terriglobia bacterium]